MVCHIESQPGIVGLERNDVDTEAQVFPPDVSLESYVRAKQIELGQELKSRRKVYLDTKYWVNLRDAGLDRAAIDGAHRLLEMLRGLAKSGSIVCPMSDALFLEIRKQTDPTTLYATAELIDELSDAVCLVGERERIGQELADILYRLGPSTGVLYEVDELVWTKVAYVLGFATPVMDGLPGTTELTLQKACVDELWKHRLADMIRMLPARDQSPDQHIHTGVSAGLNQGKFAHANEHTSYKQVFMAEVEGVLDAIDDLLGQVMARNYERCTGRRADARDRRPARMLSNSIREAIRRNRLKNAIPNYS